MYKYTQSLQESWLNNLVHLLYQIITLSLMYSGYPNIMPKIISPNIYCYFDLSQNTYIQLNCDTTNHQPPTTTTITTTTIYITTWYISYSTPKLIKAVGHSVELQTVFYGKKNFKSNVAQWMGRLSCEHKDFHSQQLLHDNVLYTISLIK
jgi:hypothetical protein